MMIRICFGVIAMLLCAVESAEANGSVAIRQRVRVVNRQPIFQRRQQVIVQPIVQSYAVPIVQQQVVYPQPIIQQRVIQQRVIQQQQYCAPSAAIVAPNCSSQFYAP